MVSNIDEPADLAAFRARREELKREPRRQKAHYNFTVMAPDDGRVIPTPLTPNVPDMVDRVTRCYVNLTQWITGFRRDIAELADAGKLDLSEAMIELSDELPNEDAAMEQPWPDTGKTGSMTR